MSTAVTVSFEFFPPGDDAAAGHLWAAVERLAPLRPRFVSVTYGADGSTRSRTHECVLRILRDTELSNAMPEAFGDVPEVTAGVLIHEAEKVWREWNLLGWGVIRYRGLMDRPESASPQGVEMESLPAIPRKRRLFAELMALHRRYTRA